MTEAQALTDVSPPEGRRLRKTSSVRCPLKERHDLWKNLLWRRSVLGVHFVDAMRAKQSRVSPYFHRLVKTHDDMPLSQSHTHGLKALYAPSCATYSAGMSVVNDTVVRTASGYRLLPRGGVGDKDEGYKAHSTRACPIGPPRKVWRAKPRL